MAVSKTLLTEFGIHPRLESCAILDQWQGSSFEFGCRYIDGNHYLKEKYDHKSDEELDATLNVWFNFGVAYIFPLGMLVVNMVLYLIPLPAFVKAKFRE